MQRSTVDKLLGLTHTHDRGVAGAALDLLTICKWYTTLGGTKIDEVVGRGQRCNLPSFWSRLTIASQAGLNLCGVKG